MLASARAAGASAAGASGLWTKYADVSMTALVIPQAHRVTCEPRLAYNDPAYLAQSQPQPQLGASLRQVGHSFHLVTKAVSSPPPQPALRTVTHERQAARAAGARLSNHAHVGPHSGPGSGAPLNFMISRMRGTLERLERLDSDGESDG